MLGPRAPRWLLHSLSSARSSANTDPCPAAPGEDAAAGWEDSGRGGAKRDARPLTPRRRAERAEGHRGAGQGCHLPGETCDSYDPQRACKDRGQRSRIFGLGARPCGGQRAGVSASPAPPASPVHHGTAGPPQDAESRRRPRGAEALPGSPLPSQGSSVQPERPVRPWPGATCAQPPSASCGEAPLTPGPRGCGGRLRSALMDCHLPRFALTPLMLTLPRERAAKKDSNNSRCNLEVVAMTRLILFSAAGRTIRVPLTLSGPDSFNYFPAPPSIRGVSLGL